MKKYILTTIVLLSQIFSFASIDFLPAVIENSDVKINVTFALSNKDIFKMKFDI